MSSERVAGMAKGLVSDVSICSGGLCHCQLLLSHENTESLCEMRCSTKENSSFCCDAQAVFQGLFISDGVFFHVEV